MDFNGYFEFSASNGAYSSVFCWHNHSIALAPYKKQWDPFLSVDQTEMFQWIGLPNLEGIELETWHS